eukprot:4667021-Prymnesium_polylepis.1
MGLDRRGRSRKANMLAASAAAPDPQTLSPVPQSYRAPAIHQMQVHLDTAAIQQRYRYIRHSRIGVSGADTANTADTAAIQQRYSSDTTDTADTTRQIQQIQQIQHHIQLIRALAV